MSLSYANNVNWDVILQKFDHTLASEAGWYDYHAVITAFEFQSVMQFLQGLINDEAFWFEFCNKVWSYNILTWLRTQI